MDKLYVPRVVREGRMTLNEYRSVHRWANRDLGEPSKCEDCGTVDAPRYHWANVSGTYREDPDDWRRLCVPCHMSLDRAAHHGVREYCNNGHRMTPDTSYLRPANPRTGQLPRVECRLCSRMSLRAWRKRRSKQ